MLWRFGALEILSLSTILEYHSDCIYIYRFTDEALWLVGAVGLACCVSTADVQPKNSA
jgi:hypothetical protein